MSSFFLLKNRAFRLLSIAVIFMFLYVGCRSSQPVIEPQEETVPADTLQTISTQTIPDHSLEANREMRAVWVATVANIDWPSEPGLPVEKQKEEMIDILNRAAALNFNAIILQVRPAADALYESPYEPWSYYLTGKMGKPPLPGYDPLEFAVAEAHKRGMELHAWFNPYRAGHPADKSEISPNHVSKIHPDWVHEYGDYLWLDPGIPEVRQHTKNVILDVVQRYDVDGVHFDDYFYPYPSYAGGADFPDDDSWKKAVENGTTLSRDDWRRSNVDSLMKELSEEIGQIKSHVKFGISPFGIWRPGYPEQTSGFDAYSELYADARLWLKMGWVDYFTPQIYYRINQVAQPFPVMLDWWVEQNDYDRHVWPGLFTSRLRSESSGWTSNEITGQVYTARGFPDVTGAVHFSMKTFMENPNHFNQILAAGPHAYPSLVPASPWLENKKPGIPTVTYHDYNSYWSLNLHPNDGDDVQWWVVRTKFNSRWEIEYYPARHRELVFFGGEGMKRPSEIVVSAVNRVGVEGERTRSIPTNDLQSDKKEFIHPPQKLIKRENWAKTNPLGYDANAIRRNLLKGDTLQFRDFSLIFTEMIESMPYPRHLFGRVNRSEEPKDSIEITKTLTVELFRNGVSEEISLEAGEALNWYGYHIGLIDANFDSGMAQFEVATVNSLPVDRASALSTGSAEYRLRVPHTIQKITLHHSGSAEPLKPGDDPKAILNGLFDWGAKDRNWWDVPYHYLIDLDGNIYEGRNANYAGETNTTYDPRGHLLISIMGNYNQQEPTQAQLDAIAEMMAYAIQKYDLSVEDIYAHGDWADTSCPGTHLQKYLDDGTIQKMVREKLNK
ncbi:family 10 glycosylhydrolase [Rhodohalobacter sp. 614A]|uniref:family 10 glycosylhydrolase n=1 Tax=Rhodohalobacter sp. 614A TaxID=2908649 RepID=UPI001F4777C8|nr:family 10 glycosylhydrolase [Rhodohalobacter sp. 614A]